MHFVRKEYAFIVQARDWSAQDRVCLVTVHYKKAYASVEGYERECSRQVVIHHSVSLVYKCSKA